MKTTNTPKERPILFSGPMVRAILDGRKTQTRREIKKATGKAFWRMFEREEGHCFAFRDELRSYEFKCPYGQPGDRLWVKETFALGSQNGIVHAADEQVFYRATDPAWDEENTAFKWKPSIFMPRRLSRITIEITDVRTERLQDITEQDAIAEGIERAPESAADATGWKDYRGGYVGQGSCDARDSYRTLWESINGPESWAANPWVWVVEFRRI